MSSTNLSREWRLASDGPRSKQPELWIDLPTVPYNRPPSTARSLAESLGHKPPQAPEANDYSRAKLKRHKDLEHTKNTATEKAPTLLKRFRMRLQLSHSRQMQLMFLAGVAQRSLKTVGIAQTLKKAIAYFFNPKMLRGGGANAARRTDLKKMPAPTRSAPEVMVQRVLLIAEVSLPQCFKYRVQQKQKMIAALGIDCTIVPWREYARCLELLQTHSIAIFYRVPGFPQVLEVIQTAKTLGVKTFWEVDDLIFDMSKYMENNNLQHLPKEARMGVLSGVPFYRSALQACGAGIASTETLARAMRDVGIDETYVIENGFDDETLKIAESVNNERMRDGANMAASSTIRIVYGSGTKTHDADFLQAAPALIRLLAQYPHVELHIAGELNIPGDFAPVASQIHRKPATNYEHYMRWLANGHISIAPLDPNYFNDAKSNIKYLEAAALKLPSVCSGSAAFAKAIIDNLNGFIANNENEWFAALARLVNDPTLRRRIGDAAFSHAIDQYSTNSLMRTQLAPILNRYASASRPFSILGVNVHFAPYSFGGATVVAEEMAKRLNATPDVRYAVFAGVPVTAAPEYETVRYEIDGVTVFGVGLPPLLNPAIHYENPAVNAAFESVLRAVRPNIVHLHSIQGIGANIIHACKTAGIPVAVTLHDAWWICGRQFMINGKGKYCGQSKIDLSICQSCVGDDGENMRRQHRLGELLQSANLLIAPSEFFRNLYIANGFDPKKVVVGKNGIQIPRRIHKRRDVTHQSRLRFGYLGGATPIKGYHLIKRAFEGLPRDDYELVLVDNAMNLGVRSIRTNRWKIGGALKVVPAFTQANVDDFYDEIDVLLFPTQWKESFGLAVREALIRDVWVIATDAGGVVEDIEPGINGDIIPLNDDGTALCTAITTLLDRNDSFANYSNPRSKQIKTFDKQAEQLLKLLESVALQ